MSQAATSRNKDRSISAAERFISGFRVMLIGVWMAGCAGALAALLWFGR